MVFGGLIETLSVRDQWGWRTRCLKVGLVVLEKTDGIDQNFGQSISHCVNRLDISISIERINNMKSRTNRKINIYREMAWTYNVTTESRWAGSILKWIESAKSLIGPLHIG
jgi:hypothetical protein